MSDLIVRPPAPLEGDVLGPDEGARLVFSESPFSRSVRHLRIEPGSSLEDAVDALGVGQRLRRHLGVYVGEHRVERALWPRVRPRPGAVIYIRVELAGGDDGKNPLRTLLMLAVVVVAWIALGPITVGLKTLGLTGFALTAAKAVAAVAIVTAGQALVNALIPIPKPTNNYAFDQQPGNPYAAITGLRNQFVPFGPIPRVMGKRLMYPVIAARPYTEQQGKTQYLRMLLLVGYGRLSISDLRIGNTPIAAFEDVEYQIVQGYDGDAAQTLYTKTIQEESLSVGLDPSDPQVRNTEPDTTEVSIDITFPYGLAHYDKQGKKGNLEVQFTVKYRAAGSGGAFTSVTWIEGKAEYGTGTNGVLKAKDAATEAVVRSGRFNVPSAGEYEIEVTRTTATTNTLIDDEAVPGSTILGQVNSQLFAGQEEGTNVDTAYWTVLRSIKASPPVNMTGLAMIAMRMKASAQLNGVPDVINCVAHSYLEAWDPEAGEAGDWAAPALSRNPAWEMTDILRRRGTKTMIADAKIDIDAFAELAAACDEEAPNAEEPMWQCDTVLEGGAMFSALQLIAAHARAQFVMKDGKYSVIRDKAQTVPVQHISPRNSRDYRGVKRFVDMPHAFRATFINPNKQYAQDERLVFRDGYSEGGAGETEAAEKYDTIDWPACTSATQAWRDTRYHIATLELRPEEHSVLMDIENLRCTKGSLVRFSHHVIAIGLGAARISALEYDDEETPTEIVGIHVDAPVDMEDGTDYGVRIRVADQTSLVKALAAAPGAGVSYLEFETAAGLAAGLAVGQLVQFGEVDLESAPMIVKEIAPGTEFEARITMVDAADGVHTADTGEIPEFESYITTGNPYPQLAPATPSIGLRSDELCLQRQPDGTLVERIRVALGPIAASEVLVSWWEVEFRPSAENSDWTNAGRFPILTSTIFISGVQQDIDYDVRARLISSFNVPGVWATVEDHTVVGKGSVPDAPQGFGVEARADGVRLFWNASSAIDVAGYEIRYGGVDWDSATPVTTTPATNYFFAITLSGVTTFRIKAIDAIGLFSAEETAASPAENTSSPFIFRGAWNSGTTYQVNDAVSYAGGTYISLVEDNLNNAPSGTASANAYWGVIAAPGAPGEPATPPSAFSATIDLSSSSVGVNLYDEAVANGYTGLSDATVTFEVESGVTITGLLGSPNGGVAIDTGEWNTVAYSISLTLVIKSGGKVYGGGGKGGAGAVGAGNGANGGKGGDAIYKRVPMAVTVDSGGELKGGGGGGGGGHGWYKRTVAGEDEFINQYPAGSGGGGFPNGAGGPAVVGIYDSDTDGDTSAASNGTTGGGGAGAAGKDEIVTSRDTEDGGAGGGAGAAGSAPSGGEGAVGTGANPWTKGNSGAAGIAGYALRHNGYGGTYTNNGTVVGTVG